MSIIPTFYIDTAEEILKQYPLPDVLWFGDTVCIMRKCIGGNERFAVLSNKNDEVLVQCADFCPSFNNCHTCWAATSQGVKRPLVNILAKMLEEADDIEMFNH